MATQLARSDEPQTLGQAIGQLRNQLEGQAKDFKSVLPSHIKPETFQRVIITAVTSDPDLLRCDRRSLVNCCMKAAQDGLLPDKREAALVVYSNRKLIDGEWVTVKEVQYMPMAYGLRKKILQSAEVKDIYTAVVYRREWDEGYFVYEEGTERMLRHKPMLDLSDEDCADDQIIAAYSMATFEDGSVSYEVMRRSEINKVRQSSQTGALGMVYTFGKNKGQPKEPKGPWVDWFAEMAKKTVMRRHSKVLPMSGDLIDIEAADEVLAARSAATLLHSVAADEPTRLPSREDDDPAHDPNTGEIQDEGVGGTELDRREAEDEDTARALDAGTAAEEEQDDQGAVAEEAEEDDGPTAQRVKAVLAEIDAAATKKALDNAEKNYLRDRVAMDEQQIADIEAALAEKRKTLN